MACQALPEMSSTRLTPSLEDCTNVQLYVIIKYLSLFKECVFESRMQICSGWYLQPSPISTGATSYDFDDSVMLWIPLFLGVMRPLGSAGAAVLGGH